jgi:hypothetical protein
MITIQVDRLKGGRLLGDHLDTAVFFRSSVRVPAVDGFISAFRRLKRLLLVQSKHLSSYIPSGSYRCLETSQPQGICHNSH